MVDLFSQQVAFPFVVVDNKSQDMTLIQKLAQMSMDQYGDDLSDIDPSTGARRKQNKNARSNDAKKDNSVVQEKQSEVADNDQNRWAVRVQPKEKGLDLFLNVL